MKFKICPRCDKKYWFNKYKCKCGFRCIIWAPDIVFLFNTDKFKVDVYGSRGYTLITSKAYKLVEWFPGYKVRIPNFTAKIPKTLSPKATDEDIEKLLLLL